MTPTELRRLCEQVVDARNGYDPAYAPMATECLKLLDQCDAMREALDLIIDHHQHIKSVSNPHPALEALSETYYVRAKQALSQLGERT